MASISPHVANPLFPFFYYLPHFSCLPSTSFSLILQSTSFSLSAIYLIFRPSLWLCFGGKTASFLTQKVFRFPPIFDKSAFLFVRIPHWIFYTITVISALFLCKKLSHLFQNVIVTAHKPAQICLTNGLLAPHTTIQVPLYTTPHHALTISIVLMFLACVSPLSTFTRGKYS